MSKYQTFLIEALRDVIAGGDMTNEQLYAAIPNPEDLHGPELKAWYALSYWADDEDIRAKDPTYGPMRVGGMVELMHKLDTT
jgi:hypothetical protein